MEEKKDRFSVKTALWSPNVENVIKEIGETCKGYKWMNLFSAKKTSQWYNLLMYSIIFIAPISGTLSAFSTDENFRLLQILVTIFSYLSGVLAAISKFAKLEQKTASYQSMAAKYASLEGNIRRQLSLQRSERVNAGSYLEWVSLHFDELFISTPLMEENVYEKWVSLAKREGLIVPKDLGQNVDIDISKEKEEKQQLQNVGTILVNDEEKKIPVVIVEKQKKKKRRNNDYDTSVDLNRYTDQMMLYEMSRLNKN